MMRLQRGVILGRRWVASKTSKTSSALEAAAMVQEGATVLSGGFGLCGIAENTLAAICARVSKRLSQKAVVYVQNRA